MVAFNLHRVLIGALHSDGCARSTSSGTVRNDDDGDGDGGHQCRQRGDRAGRDCDWRRAEVHPDAAGLGPPRERALYSIFLAWA